jgi:hypothetical protein
LGQLTEPLLQSHQILGKLFDGGPLADTLGAIKTFLDANPNEVRIKRTFFLGKT